jgi:hypothetical protein
MAASVHRPFKVMAFNANDIWMRRYELCKELQNLYRDVAVLSETHLKPHEGLLIPNYHFYRTSRFPGKRDSPQICRRSSMLYVRYVHLTKAKLIRKIQPYFLVRGDAT